MGGAALTTDWMFLALGVLGVVVFAALLGCRVNVYRSCVAVWLVFLPGTGLSVVVVVDAVNGQEVFLDGSVSCPDSFCK